MTAVTDPALQQWLRALAASPALFLRELDLARDRAVLVPMDEAGYRASTFLDSRLQRASGADVGTGIGALAHGVAATMPAPAPLHFLFHIGHCGSSLLSRLLGELPGLFSLREPPPLLLVAQVFRYLGTPGFAITQAQWQVLHGLVLRLLSRSFRAGDTALVKPMSHVNAMLGELLRWHPDCRGVFLFVDARTFLATMLKPRNRGEATIALRESRLRDYERMTGERLPLADVAAPGVQAALIWLLQMTEGHEAMQAPDLRPRLHALHFDAFLAEPQQQLSALASHLGAPAEDAAVRAVLGGPLMQTYAKSNDTAFGPAQRRAELAAGMREFATEMAEGLAWVERQAARHPRFAPVLAANPAWAR